MPRAGPTIRKLRKEAGYTLDALAEQLKCSKAHLSLMESGRRTVSLDWARRIERVLLKSRDDAATSEGKNTIRTDGPIVAAVQWDATPPSVRRRVSASQAMVDQLRQAMSSRDPLAAMRKLIDTDDRDDAQADIQTGAHNDASATTTARSGDDSAPVNIALPHQIPVINRVAAGEPTEFTDLDYPASVADEYISCPDVHDPNAFGARISGDSMSPDYREGEVVVFAPNQSPRSGSDCFVRLFPDNETTFKRVFFDEEDHADDDVRLQPINAAHPPCIVNRDLIAGMYPAVYVLRPITPPDHNDAARG